MNKKTIGAILLVLALGVLGYWVANGARLWDQDKVEEIVKDDLWGTESKVWRDEFRPGLLPYIGPIAGAFLAGSIWMFASSRKGRKPGLGAVA